MTRMNSERLYFVGRLCGLCSDMYSAVSLTEATVEIFCAGGYNFKQAEIGSITELVRSYYHEIAPNFSEVLSSIVLNIFVVFFVFSRFSFSPPARPPACPHAMAWHGMPWHAMACLGMPWHAIFYQFCIKFVLFVCTSC